MTNRTYYWGTPLEILADTLLVEIMFLCYSPDEVYETAKKLFHAFNRVNPNFWKE